MSVCQGNVDPEEMLRTFNCGIGMVVVVARELASDVQRLISESGERALPIGHVTARLPGELFSGHAFYSHSERSFASAVLCRCYSCRVLRRRQSYNWTDWHRVKQSQAMNISNYCK